MARADQDDVHVDLSEEEYEDAKHEIILENDMSSIIFKGQEVVYEEDATETFGYEEMLRAEKVIRNHHLDPTYKRMDEIPYYGPTVKLQFYKEQLEQRFNIHKAPDMCNPPLIIVIVVAEVLLGVFIYNLHFVFELGDRYDAKEEGSNYTLVDNIFLDYESLKGNAGVAHRCSSHAMLFSVSFALVFPQILLSKILFSRFSENALFVMDFSLKIGMVVCSMFGFKSIFDEKHAYNFKAADGGIHQIVGNAVVVFVFTYIIVVAIKLFGYLVPGLYHTRIIGRPLRVLNNSTKVADGILHTGNMIGLLGISTGYICFLSNLRKEFFDGKVDELLKFEIDRKVYIGDFKLEVQAAFGCFIIGQVFVEMCMFRSHCMKYHTHSLTFQEFRDNGFSNFAKIYEKESIRDMGQAMPKVNTPIRML